MRDEILTIMAGSSEEDAIRDIATAAWERMTPNQRTQLNSMAQHQDFDDGFSIVLDFVSKQRAEFDSIDDWLSQLPGQTN